ncbi:acyl-CoA thioesterase [Sulfurospirillum arcachonense]|uniref:acyl-CoA thioesterase n=1 Tax=Sulfurospirillum arcachonense TaxID=57666 RepID=UPI00046AD6DB|nr:acyl-CoA thioesterase [Sulfurospirillum arcachonense]
MKDMGEPRIKILAMPKDTNPAGNIFGGWIMSQMDIAGALAARDLHLERVVTIAVNAMEFHEPIFVGDAVSYYARIIKIGNTSIKTVVEVTAERNIEGIRRCVHVTSGVITYVSVTKNGEKAPIQCSEAHKRALLSSEI